jgi:spore germination protein
LKAIYKRVFAVLLFILCLTQTGCWDKKIYEDIGFILQTGLELNEDKQLLCTITVPVFEEGVQNKVEALSATGDFFRESREQISHTLGMQVEAGKVQQIYISTELAEKGIMEYLDVFLRNPENPLLANIIVVDGSPKELMAASIGFKNKPLPAIYANNLLVEARRNGYTPETRVYDFAIKTYSKTIDTAAPLMTYDAKSISVAGTALFDDGKMIGEIDTSQSALLSLLMGRNAVIQYVYRMSDKDEGFSSGAAILIKDSGRKVTIYTEGDTLKINIKLNMKASIAEYNGTKQLDKRKDLEKLEQEIGESMEKESIELLKYMQQINADPAGFGEIVRSRYNDYWKSIQWKDVYKDVAFSVDVKLKFEFYGAIN